MPVFGEEVYPGIHQKAAVLISAINHNHPLLDGNKRLSAAAAAVAFSPVLPRLRAFTMGPCNTHAATSDFACAGAARPDNPDVVMFSARDAATGVPRRVKLPLRRRSRDARGAASRAR